MAMTVHDYRLIAKLMKENIEAQTDDQRRDHYVLAYQNLANQIAMSDKYKNFNISKFMKQAGLK